MRSCGRLLVRPRLKRISRLLWRCMRRTLCRWTLSSSVKRAIITGNCRRSTSGGLRFGYRLPLYESMSSIRNRSLDFLSCYLDRSRASGSQTRGRWRIGILRRTAGLTCSTEISTGACLATDSTRHVLVHMHARTDCRHVVIQDVVVAFVMSMKSLIQAP